MKKIVYVPFVSALFISGLLFLSAGVSKKSITSFHGQKLVNTSGPSAGLTGAPGEVNCTNCHAGAVQDGNNGVNVIELGNGQTVFTPGETISVKLTLSDASNKNGFQLVALNEANEMAGSFSVSDAVNTQLRNGSGGTDGRIYVTHTAAGTTQSEWNFDWTTPAINDEVTFYVATNKTDGTNGSGNDVIYLSSHTFLSDGTAQLENTDEFSSSLLVGYEKFTNTLIVEGELPSTNDISLSVLDLSGKAIHFEAFSNQFAGTFKEKIVLPSSLNDGIYIATIFVGNKPYSKKFMVTK